MISHGRENSITLAEIESKISEGELLQYYLGIKEVPCVIKSPLREDKRASFGIYSLDGIHIYYTDFSTKDTGSTYQLLSKMWGLTFSQTLEKIYHELVKHDKTINVNAIQKPKINVYSSLEDNTNLEVKIRDWKDYDIEYWKSYGVPLEWLKWAEVYPISFKIVIKNDRRYVFPAEKYAYAFVEHKENNVTLKIYQPFSTTHKWANKHDRSVVSLWTKIPQTGDKVVICSSLKDALCLSANTKIPALAIQGEGYGMSDTAIAELRKRFSKQYIILDNDKAGLSDAVKLAERTGFTNLVIPSFEGGKDLSDYFKLFGKSRFVELIKNLFQNG
jgi:hypothetical protein